MRRNRPRHRSPAQPQPTSRGSTIQPARSPVFVQAIDTGPCLDAYGRRPCRTPRLQPGHSERPRRPLAGVAKNLSGAPAVTTWAVPVTSLSSLERFSVPFLHSEWPGVWRRAALGGASADSVCVNDGVNGHACGRNGKPAACRCGTADAERRWQCVPAQSTGTRVGVSPGTRGPRSPPLRGGIRRRVRRLRPGGHGGHGHTAPGRLGRTRCG